MALVSCCSGFSDVVDGHKSRTFSGAFHPSDPNFVATGGWDNLIQFWDVRLAQSARHCGDAHVGGTESLDFSPNGNEVKYPSSFQCPTGISLTFASTARWKEGREEIVPVRLATKPSRVTLLCGVGGVPCHPNPNPNPIISNYYFPRHDGRVAYLSGAVARPTIFTFLDL